MTRPIRERTGCLARRAVAIAITHLCVVVLAPASWADLDADQAEALATATWFEGMPEEQVETLSPAAVQRLATLLDDPEVAAHHAQILELLGRAGGPGSFEVVSAFAARSHEGEVDTATYQAQLAIPLALGHLARTDSRALALLMQRAQRTGDAPWRYRKLDAARIARLQQRMNLAGLAYSGRPESAALLRALSRDGDSGDRAHAREMIDLHSRSAAGEVR